MIDPTNLYLLVDNELVTHSHDQVNSSSSSVETVSEFTQLSNTYGFMTVFSVVVLLLITGFMIMTQRTAAKRQKSEITLLEKERTNNMEQNNKMYDIVINVQSEQVSQLREMTNTLKVINDKSVETRDKITDMDITMHHMDSSLENISTKDDTILKTLAEILAYVKSNDHCNKDILAKVKKIDEFLQQEYKINNQ